MKSNVEASSRENKRAARLILRMAPTASLLLGLMMAPGLRAQVTNGKKPELPPPFASKSATNPAQEGKLPQGFLPTVPEGFKINIFAADFKGPRWMVLAPNGDIFLADTAAGKLLCCAIRNTPGARSKMKCLQAGCESHTALFFMTTTCT